MCLSLPLSPSLSVCVCVCVCGCAHMCVCVCVCVRACEREREGGEARGRDTSDEGVRAYHLSWEGYKEGIAVDSSVWPSRVSVLYGDAMVGCYGLYTHSGRLCLRVRGRTTGERPRDGHG
jgi:hypothetical protein